MVFGAKCTLDAHIETVHEKKKPHLCNLCGKAFSAKKALQYHIRCVHEKKKPFSCTICENKFTTKKAQRMHIETVHEKIRFWFYEKNNFPCLSLKVAQFSRLQAMLAIQRATNYCNEKEVPTSWVDWDQHWGVDETLN